MEEKDRILELERELSRLKEELDSVSQAYDISVVQNKNLGARIDKLSRNMDALHFELAGKKPKTEIPQPVVEVQPVVTEIVETPVMDATPVVTITPVVEPQPVADPQPQPQPVTPPKAVPPVQPVRPVPQPKAKEKKKGSMESFFGKNIMAIAAAVLIFISFFIFASIIYVALSDGLKVFLMYLVSVAITATGLILLKKNPDSWWCMALSSIGLGCVFISLFLSNLYFHIFGDIVLYVLLLIWAVFITILSKKRSVIFQIIGHIGILISVTAGGAKIFSEISVFDNLGKLLCIVIFFLITSTVMWITHLDKAAKKNRVSDIFNIVTFIILTIQIGNGFENLSVSQRGAMVAIIMLVMGLYVAVTSIFRHVYYEVDDRDLIYPIISVIYMMIAVFIMNMFIDVMTSGGVEIAKRILDMLIPIPYLILAMKKFEDKTIQRMLITIPSLIMIMDYYGMLPLVQFTGYYIFAIGLLIWAFMKDELADKIIAIVITLIAIFVGNDMYGAAIEGVLELDYHVTDLLSMIGLAVTATTLLVLIKKYEHQYKMSYKVLATLGLLIAIVATTNILFDDILDYSNGTVEVISLVECFAYMVAMTFTNMKKNWYTGEEERFFTYLYRVCMEVLVIVSLSSMADSINGEHGAVYATIFMFITLAAAVVNIMPITKDFKGIGAIYSGIKTTIVILAILGIYDVNSAVISIVAFLIAIACIVTGFRFNFKGLRIYGLVITLISTIKLVIIDIDYKSTLGHAASLFICGILCLLVSYIYTRVEKKYGEQSEQTLEA